AGGGRALSSRATAQKNHHTTSRPATPRYAVPMPNQPTPDPAPQPPTLIDHPTDSSFWRHSPPLWRPCGVCGHPTCWVELDIGFKHPECGMFPGPEGVVIIELGERLPPGGERLAPGRPAT